jgi:hypothetical protein
MQSPVVAFQTPWERSQSACAAVPGETLGASDDMLAHPEAASRRAISPYVMCFTALSPPPPATLYRAGQLSGTTRFVYWHCRGGRAWSTRQLAILTRSSPDKSWGARRGWPGRARTEALPLPRFFVAHTRITSGAGVGSCDSFGRLVQRVPRGHLHRLPWGRFEGGARGVRRRMLHVSPTPRHESSQRCTIASSSSSWFTRTAASAAVKSERRWASSGVIR